MRSFRVAPFLACTLAIGGFALPASAAPGWTATNTLSEAALSLHAKVDVAMDAVGDTMVVWCELRGATESVEAAWRPAGGSFGIPVGVSPVGLEAADPVLAMDPQGDATVAWVSRRFGSYEYEGFIEAAWAAPGGAFGTPVEVGTDFEDEAPAVAMDSNGDASVAWLRYSAGGRFVQAVWRPAGGVFSKESNVSSNAPGNAETIGRESSAPTLAMGPAGDAAIGWSTSEKSYEPGFNGAPYFMQLRRQLSGGTLGPTIEFAPNRQSTPIVAVDEQGDVEMVWSTGAIIEAATLASNSNTFNAPILLSNPNTLEVKVFATEPAIAVNATGETLVAWLYGTQPAAVAYTLGGTVGQPTELGRPGANAGGPVVAIDPRGDSVTMWTNTLEGVPVVEGSTRPHGGPFGQSVALATTGAITAPVQVAMDSQGDAVSAWATSDGTHESIRVAGYQASGPRIEALQSPSEGQAGAALSFSVSPLSVLSTVTSTIWSWGDGTSNTTGASTSHIFATPGVFQITVSATDALGNATSVTRTVDIRAGSTEIITKIVNPPKPPPKHKPLVTSAFKARFGTRVSLDGSVIGLLVKLGKIHGTANGETLVIRCVAGCDHPLHQTVHVGHGHLNGELTITNPLVLHANTRIEIDLQAPHHITRYVQYRFTRTPTSVRPHPTRQGCLSPTRHREACLTTP
jgi:hypothetical protein